MKTVTKDILFTVALLTTLFFSVYGFHLADEYADWLYALPIACIIAFIALIRWKSSDKPKGS